MNTTRKSIKTLLILAGLIAISGVLLIMDIDRMLVEGETKRNLLICVVWILIVLLIRGARYSVFRDQDQLMRCGSQAFVCANEYNTRCILYKL